MATTLPASTSVSSPPSEQPSLTALPPDGLQDKGSFAACMTPWQADLDKVKAILRGAVPEAFASSAWLVDAMAYTLDTPGKMLRPLLCLMVSQATAPQAGNKNQASFVEETAHPHRHTVAAVAEMIHIATLLHDDVLDDAELRRGRPTVRLQWGNTVAILSGDYLLAQASRLLAQMGVIRLVAIYSDVLADLCDGEIEQLRTQKQVSNGQLVLDWESYRRKSLCKTASLFGAVCESAAVLNGLDETRIGHLRQFGEKVGLAFQIVDDLLDYQSTQAVTGKPVLNDLRQGLLTAPILLAFEGNRLDKSSKERLNELVTAIFSQTEETIPSSQEAALAEIQTLLQQAGVFTATQQLAQTTLEEALIHLQEAIPQPTRREALETLAIQLIGRNH